MSCKRMKVAIEEIKRGALTLVSAALAIKISTQKDDSRTVGHGY